MIAADQPTIFPAEIIVAVSSVDDGSMKSGTDPMPSDAERNRQKFLENLMLPVDRATVFSTSFDSKDYCRYMTAAPGLQTAVDGVLTVERRQPIILPLADCTGAVIYDPVNHILMVSHLGRHSTEQYGGLKSIEYMASQHHSIPSELLVWLGPSPNSEDYPLWAFDNRSFRDVLTDQLLSAGVRREHLEISSVDTASNPNYYSHSQYLKHRQNTDGRFAIVAMLH